MWGISRVRQGRGLAREARSRWALAAASLTLAAAPSVARAGVPIGAHSMLYLNSPAPLMDAMFAQAAAMQASAIRLDVAPALIFPSQGGAPDFSGLDAVMALAARYHLRVLADLLSVPPWMAACTAPDALTQSRCPPASVADYGQMIGRIVRHATPVIRDWEVWNEPNRGEFFGGTPQDYAGMLRAAHDAIKAADPQASVVLGGITGTAGLTWLDQMLATPGADAIHGFDVANLHERGGLDTMAPDVAAVRAFFATRGFGGPLWVTEHGYPADPAFQWDPAYRTGADAQAAYLTASIPSLVSAGASEVFVTERDNLSGPDASEGLLSGAVDSASVVARPAFAAVSRLAGCYQQLGRDCPGPAPAASVATLAIPPVALGYATDAAVTVSDPGLGPLQLDAATVSSPPTAGLSLARDGCPPILEPDQTCMVDVHFAPQAGGATLGLLRLGSDNGALQVPITAVAASVSSLISPQLPQAAFRASPAGDGVGSPQSLLLAIVNPLAASVGIYRADLSGHDAGRFRLVADSCRARPLAAGQSCGVAVVFTPRRAGTAHATLTLAGQGHPLAVPLAATASAAPAIRRIAVAADRGRCAGSRLVIITDQPTALRWRAVRSSRAPAGRCALAGARGRAARRPSAAAGVVTTAARPRTRRGRHGYVATVRLPRGLRSGTYGLTVTPTGPHGSGRTWTVWVTGGGAG